MNLSLEQFRTVIDFLDFHQADKEDFDKKFKGIFTVEFECKMFNTDSLINLLEVLFCDFDDWLSYYYYECNCDLKELNNCVEQHDGNFDLSTIEGFYKFFCQQTYAK